MGEIVSTCTLRATKRSAIDDEITDPDSVCDRYTPRQSNFILGYQGGLGTISEDTEWGNNKVKQGIFQKFPNLNNR
jgi:hypothetical protein